MCRDTWRAFQLMWPDTGCLNIQPHGATQLCRAHETPLYVTLDALGPILLDQARHCRHFSGNLPVSRHSGSPDRSEQYGPNAPRHHLSCLGSSTRQRWRLRERAICKGWQSAPLRAAQPFSLAKPQQTPSTLTPAVLHVEVVHWQRLMAPVLSHGTLAMVADVSAPLSRRLLFVPLTFPPLLPGVRLGLLVAAVMLGHAFMVRGDDGVQLDQGVANNSSAFILRDSWPCLSRVLRI